MTNLHLKLVAPATENRTVTPTRRPNSELRPREYLTEVEVTKLIETVRKNRNGLRDALMVLLAYRHGLRVSELVGLQWSDVNFKDATLHVRRSKGSQTGVHPIQGDELRQLRALKRSAKSAFVFTSERGAPFATAGFAKLIERAGVAGKFEFPLHPHMLRHSTGFGLINRGVDLRTLQSYLGHRSIQSTVIYSALNSGAFKNIWR
jgi:type 1 fimbriae regulatory protein FimB/type 1 fimbriae regulatory protein FimE